MTARPIRLAFDAAPSLGAELAESFLEPCLPVLPAPTGSHLVDHLPLPLLSDDQLAERLRSGQAQALTVLFERHSARVFAVARRILRDEAEAEDTVQTIFLDVYRAIDQFDRNKGNFKTWLFLFAYQRTFNRRRQLIASRYFVTESIDELSELCAPGKSLSTQSSSESRVLVQQVLRRLQPRQRRTIELMYVEGLTAKEVSDRTGETVRVVRHNLYRGLEKLRLQIFPDRSQRKGEEGQR